MPVPQAAAIMLPLLLGDGRVRPAAAVRRERDRALLRLLLPAGLLGTLVGTLLFGVLSAKAVAGVVGALTLLFLAQRLLFPPRADAPPPPRWLGFVLGIASGFTSFVAHAGGPPISAYVLPLRCRRSRFTATMAVFFAAMNASKWIPYAWLGLIDARNMPHVAGADAAGAARRVARREADAARQAAAVLPARLRRHAGHRRQAAVGWPALS